MAAVTVTPQEYKFVDFDGGVIGQIAEKVLADFGIDRDLELEVDETTPLSRMEIVSTDPLKITVESGAFEDSRKPRHLSEDAVGVSLATMLLRHLDRVDGGFADAPSAEDLDLQQLAAWETYIVGRVARKGYRAQKQRRLYHFRNRHGFNDRSDEVFNRLWNADKLSWADILEVCAETEEYRATYADA